VKASCSSLAFEDVPHIKTVTSIVKILHDFIVEVYYIPSNFKEQHCYSCFTRVTLTVVGYFNPFFM
jgi:hypothetical protein